MDDVDSEGLELQEYSPSADGDSKITLSRISKTIVVTGVVISSAPFILPPLMLLSAVGLVCSVPFGVFVASYAFAEKLMSKLLPMPKPSPPVCLMLEYKENEVSCNFYLLSDEYDIYVDDDDVEMELDSKFPLRMSEEDMDVEQEGETKADKYCDGKGREEEQQVEEGNREVDESTDISKTEISGREIFRQERPVDNVSIDDSKLAEKTHEDLACRAVEVEGPYGLNIGAMEQITPGKEAADAYQAKQSMTAKHGAIKIDDVSGTGRTAISGVNETAICTPADETIKTSEHELEANKDNRSKHGFNIDHPNVSLAGETHCMQKDNLEEQHVAADATSTTKRKKKAKKTKPKSEETTAEVQKIHSAKHNGTISATVDARNTTDEGRLKLVEDKDAGEETQTNKTVAGLVQATKPGALSTTPSGRSIKASGKKALFSEETIWENIEALRTIVGYRAARHESSMEELKALYIFTGVEPPMSFKSSPDLDDVNEKLRFLMAIVGVK